MVPLQKQIIELYEYQQDAYTKIVSALKETFQALIVLATGLGKTFLSIEVVRHFVTPKDRILFLCHDNGILNKAYKEYKAHMGDEYTYAKFYGDDKDWEADKHHFVFATFQSVFAHLQDEKTKKKLFYPEHFTFIVVDESHHSQAETFAEVINYFKPKYLFGMTATPDREDHMDIRDIFGAEVVNIRLPEAIAKGWLTPIEYKLLSDGLNEEKIREICKDVLDNNIRLTENQINEKIFIKVRTEEQCKIMQEYSNTHKTIVFCENIEHANHVATLLPSSVTIHSKQSTKINDDNFSLFENGHVQHAVVVDKFNEGIDVPDTELLSFMRATSSERIFLHQLGRGLRLSPDKKKVIVLDFVGNVERIKHVANLAQEVERITGIEREKGNLQSLDNPLHVEGNGFSFDFSKEVVDLLAVLEKLKQDFYPTWEEAGRSAHSLGIGGYEDYIKKYKQDARLGSHPDRIYKDFPGWIVFLGKELPTEKYLTCQEASQAAQVLDIQNWKEYNKKYKQDPFLPSSPNTFYSDFPGWFIFLGKEIPKKKYLTWQESSIAVQMLGIRTEGEYREKYKQDIRLYSNPSKNYEDFPGWKNFLGSNKKDYYQTWQEAGQAAITLGIKKFEEYLQKYKQDLRLPRNLYTFYEDFPGWKKFLEKE